MNFSISVLDVLPSEELIQCFHRHKTEISSHIQEPHTFISQLKDYKLVSDDLYKKVMKMKSKENIQKGVYQVLQQVEDHGKDCVKEFWHCVFQEHMLRKYPFLHVLQNKLYARQFMVPSKPSIEKPTGSEEKSAEQEERGTKRKKIVEIEEEEEPGPSLVSSSDHTKPMYDLESSPEEIESSDEQQKDSGNEDSVQDSQFEADLLPVSCGSVSGKLYKTRFTGASTKSIRAEERWFTPEEFVKQGITRTDGHWERDILCHGKTLKHLVQKKILDVHPQGCRCQLCHPKKTHQEKDDDVCNICNRGENLVNCTECSLAFHHHCHLPALQDKKPVSNWKCTFCLVKNYLAFWISMDLNVALKSPVSGNLRCEYLLLHLYKDTQLMLTERNVTKLDQVKNKLQNNEYKTVKEFVQDINHIYKSSNMGNVPVQGEDKVHKNFHQNFISVFKIQ